MGLDRAHTLPTLPEKSTRGHLFWKSKSPKEEQPLKGGTHERHKTSWFGSSHSKHGGPDSTQGSARHSRTHSLEDQIPSAQNSDIGLETAPSKKGHRRAGSLSSFLRKNLGIGRRSDSVGSADELDQMDAAWAGQHESFQASRFTLGPVPLRGAAGAGPVRTSSGSVAGAGSLACFGLGPRPSGEFEDAGVEQVSAPATARGSQPSSSALPSPAVPQAPPPEAVQPLRATGIRNLGNTCFVNAALQCLRHTPGLATRLAPDLPRRLEARAAARSAALSIPGAPDGAGAVGQTGDAVEMEEPGSVDVHALASASTDRSGALDALAAGLATGRGERNGLSIAEEEEGAEGGATETGKRSRCQGEGGFAVHSEEGEPDEHALRADEVGSRLELAGDILLEEGDEGGSALAEGMSDDDDRDERDGAPEAGATSEQDAAAPEGPAEASGDGATPASQQHPSPAAVPAKPARPAHGELLSSFLQLLAELYLRGEPGGLDPSEFVRMLRRYPIAAEFLDGGQHDCQEVLRVLMDLLHDDLKPPKADGGVAGASPSAAMVDTASSVASPSSLAESTPLSSPVIASQTTSSSPTPLAAPSPSTSHHVASKLGSPLRSSLDKPGASPAKRSESETEKALRHWRSYLAQDSSIVTDLFGGQLQSSITCHRCGGRFTMYEPFWDLSLPLAKEGKQSSLSWLGLRGSPASIGDCLAAYAADEKLEGDEAFSCEACRAKTPATKHLRVHRLPEILVLHIKRFKYRGFFTDKLTASVSYPLSGLSLDDVLSPEALAEGRGGAQYDLFAVSNHYGNLTGGHYTAMCRTLGAPDSGWYCFNDEIVNRVVSQYAYILFYARRPGTGGAH